MSNGHQASIGGVFENRFDEVADKVGKLRFAQDLQLIVRAGLWKEANSGIAQTADQQPLRKSVLDGRNDTAGDERLSRFNDECPDNVMP